MPGSLVDSNINNEDCSKARLQLWELNPTAHSTRLLQNFVLTSNGEL